MSNPIASTSKTVSKAPLKFDLLKRKERDDDEQQQQPKNNDDGEEKKQDVAEDPTAAFLSWKKPKKEKKVLVRRVVEKKIAVWKDIGEWQEGDDPLGRFPVEVLDLIISIDSDLDLRDHLALAGTCRYFRTCYRDVVFQVLYHSKNPKHRFPSSHTTIDSDGQFFSYLHSSFIGQVQRSWNEARHIFSSSALPRDGWSVPNDEWDNSDAKIEQDEQRAVLVKLLREERDAMKEGFREEVEKRDAETLEYWTRRKEAWDASEKKKREEHEDAEKIKQDTAAAAGEPYVPTLYSASASGYAYGWNPGPGERPTPDGEWGVQKKLEEMLKKQTELYGKWVRPANHVSPPENNPKVAGSKRVKEVVTARDPWESAWRYIVSDVVNKPRITKTDAIRIYKVNEKELAALPMRHQTWKKRQKGIPRYYIKSSVEALSLRSHGGAAGHQERLDKLQATKEKAHATRVKNGTLKVAKPKPMRYHGYWNDYGYDY